MKGAVRVFRRWRTNERFDEQAGDFRPVLSSLVLPYDWAPGVNVAVDLGNEGLGWAGDGPGFYGYFRPRWEAKYSTVMMSVTGSILGFGKVNIHERGARCGKAVVEAIAAPGRDVLERAVDYYNHSVFGLYGECYQEYERDESTVGRAMVTCEEVWARYEQLAVYYNCLLVPWDVLMGMPTGELEGQPVRGVQL